MQFDPLDRVVLGNSISAWLTATAVATAIWFVLYAVKVVVGRRLTALAVRTATEVDDVAAALLEQTRFYFILALALRAGSIALNISGDASSASRRITAIAVLLQIARWGNTIINFWIRRWTRSRGGSESATFNAISVMARGALWIIILLLALVNVLDYDVTALITGLGIGGVAIALAVQNILADLFAALSIVLDKPFDVGDTISVDNFTGRVERIGLKTTRVRAIGGEEVIFGNGDLLKSRVRNLTIVERRQVLFRIGVTYDTPPDVVARIPVIIKEIVTAQPKTEFDRAHFVRFAESALEVEVNYFVSNSYGGTLDVQQAVNLAILERFNADRIAFAFATQTVIHQNAPAVTEPSATVERKAS
ncbi:MAG: mechanosensitive ion channel family protein [Gemmatimonadaceae bacterium]